MKKLLKKLYGAYMIIAFLGLGLGFMLAMVGIFTNSDILLAIAAFLLLYIALLGGWHSCYEKNEIMKKSEVFRLIIGHEIPKGTVLYYGAGTIVVVRCYKNNWWRKFLRGTWLDKYLLHIAEVGQHDVLPCTQKEEQ